MVYSMAPTLSVRFIKPGSGYATRKTNCMANDTFPWDRPLQRTGTNALGWGKQNDAKARFRSEGPESGRRWHLNPLIVRGWHYDRYNADGEPILFAEDQLLDEAFLHALSTGEIHGGCLGARAVPNGEREFVDCFAITGFRDVRWSLVAWRMPEPSAPPGGHRTHPMEPVLSYHIEVGYEKTAFVALTAVGTLIDIDRGVENLTGAVKCGPRVLETISKGLAECFQVDCELYTADPDRLPDPPSVIAERVEKYRARARL